MSDLFQVGDRGPTGATLIGAALARAGVTHAFGLPGGEVLALMEGLAEAGITFVLARHENAAGFMAEGLWHATGALPVLVATLGPGVANAVNVVSNALQDRVPLIFLTGCVDAELAETYTHQVFDHQAVLRPIVKASFRASPGALGPMIAKAIRVAREGQPGPVHIDVPIGVAEARTQEPPPPPPLLASRSSVSVDDETLRRAVRELSTAERPLMIAGVDAVNEAAGPAITDFCRRHGIPLLTTYKGKGLMPEDDPLALGGVGLSPRADAIALPLVAAADCILLAGYDPIEMRTGWRNPWGPDRTVIEITAAPRLHGMHTTGIELRGEIAPLLATLDAGMIATPRWTDGAAARAREALIAAFAPQGYGPAAVFHALRETLPPGTIVTADSGAHRILLSQIWRCSAPRGLLQSTGLCTMGCAVPLAAGYALGRPGARVMAVVGDGGLEMGLGELATLRDLGLPVLIVTLVDGSLALIDMKQRGTGRPRLGVDIGISDLPLVARAMGGHGAWIEDIETLRTEASAALTRPTFTLLAVRVPRGAYDGTF